MGGGVHISGALCWRVVYRYAGVCGVPSGMLGIGTYQSPQDKQRKCETV